VFVTCSDYGDRVSLGARWLAYGLDLLLPYTQTMTDMEARMAQIAAALAELDSATNEVAAELEALTAQVSNLDADTAARITAAATRLRGLAADPENPVPPVEG
jgi:hypothetical protein